MLLIKIALIVLSSILSILVLLGIPGTWGIVLLSSIYAYFADFVPIGTDKRVLIILASMAGVAELLEILVSLLGSRKRKVAKATLIASIICGIIGSLFLSLPVPLVGSFVGLLVGTFCGAFFYEGLTGASSQKPAPEKALQTQAEPVLSAENHLSIEERGWGLAFKIALAVLVSRVIASFLKTAIAVAMAVYLAFRLF